MLAANDWLGGYELDLVLRRGRTIVFCEVKSKGGVGHGDPLEMISAEKRRRLARAAEAWLARHPEHEGCEARFDVVAERPGEVQRLEGAF